MPVAIAMAIKIIPLLISAAGEIPSVIAAAKNVVTLLKEQRDPTADEQATYDAALEEANNAV